MFFRYLLLVFLNIFTYSGLFAICPDLVYLLSNDKDISENANIGSLKLQLRDAVHDGVDYEDKLKLFVLDYDSEKINFLEKLKIIDAIQKLTKKYASKPVSFVSISQFKQIYEALEVVIPLLALRYDRPAKYILLTIDTVDKLLQIKAPYYAVIAGCFLYDVRPIKEIKTLDDFDTYMREYVPAKVKDFGVEVVDILELYKKLNSPALNLRNNITVFDNKDYDHNKILEYFNTLKLRKLNKNEKSKFREKPIKVKYLPKGTETKLSNIYGEYGNEFEKQVFYDVVYMLSVLSNTGGVFAVQLKLIDELNSLKQYDTHDNYNDILNIVQNSLSFSNTMKRLLASMVEAEFLYANLADILGFGVLKAELSDLAVKYISPLKYNLVLQYLNDNKIFDHKEAVIASATSFLNSIKDIVNSSTKKFNKQNIVISGRPKSISSIVGKLERNKPFSIIYDYYAFRIIADKTEFLYYYLLNALPQKGERKNIQFGFVSAISSMRPEALSKPDDMLNKLYDTGKQFGVEFDATKIINVKDYVKKPKDNGYQSIHFTINIGTQINPVYIEVQLRTFRMHRFAEYGLADHYLYKDGGFQHDPIASFVFDNIYNKILGIRKDNVTGTGDGFKDIANVVIPLKVVEQGGYTFFRMNTDW